MEQVTLIVTLEFQPASKASLLQALFEHKQRCLATEPGTLQFDIMGPSDNANAVVLFERYANSQALAAHEAGASLALFKQQAGALITKASGQHCAVLNG